MIEEIKAAFDKYKQNKRHLLQTQQIVRLKPAYAVLTLDEKKEIEQRWSIQNDNYDKLLLESVDKIILQEIQKNSIEVKKSFIDTTNSFSSDDTLIDIPLPNLISLAKNWGYHPAWIYFEYLKQSKIPEFDATAATKALITRLSFYRQDLPSSNLFTAPKMGRPQPADSSSAGPYPYQLLISSFF